MNAISGSLPGAICDAARIGQAMDTAAAEWMASQRRQEGTSDKEAWLREDEITSAIGSRFIALAEEVSWRKASSLEGALAQTIAAGHFLSILLDSDPRPSDRKKATQALRRLVYSIHGAMRRELDPSVLEEAAQHSLSPNFDPFKQPAPAAGGAA